LKKVCETTENPEIYRLNVSGARDRVQLKPTSRRGRHNIDDELIFTSHDGYVFHDSRGFESGDTDELKIVKEFVGRKSQEKRLRDRLHAIWYCTPTDGDRPSVDLKFFDEIRPDMNVPVIAVFTKFDQLRRNEEIKLTQAKADLAELDARVEAKFKKDYLNGFSKRPPLVRLERINKDGKCADLIQTTANELSPNVVTLMLAVVQRGNLELSMKQVIGRTHVKFKQGIVSTEVVIKMCIMSFPSLWLEAVQRELDLEALNSFDEYDFDLDYFEDMSDDDSLETLLSKLKSFIAEPPISASSDDAHHTMIVAVLILECASLLCASPSAPTLYEALDNACSRYVSSDTHTAVKQQFLLSPSQYSIREFTEFVLTHHL